MREAENIVDEEQRIRALGVAEIFRNRESGQRDAQARARRLRHLPVDERGLRFRGLTRLDDARFRHLQPQIVAFARALAHAGKHRIAAVVLGDVIDQLHDDDRLANSGAAEQADLAALQERLDQIDDLYARLEHLSSGGLLVEGGSQTVNRISFLVFDGAQLIDRFADDVHHAPQRAAAHRH